MEEFINALEFLDIVIGLKELFVSKDPAFDKAEGYFKRARKAITSSNETIESATYIKEQAIIASQLFDKCEQSKHYQRTIIFYYKGLCSLYISASDCLLNPKEVKNDLGKAISFFKKICNEDTSFMTENVDAITKLKAEANELIILTSRARDSWFQAEGKKKPVIDIKAMDFNYEGIRIIIGIVVAALALSFFIAIS